MSKLAKVLWLVSGLSLAALVTIRYILGGWTTDWLFLPLGLFGICFLGALVIDYKFYLEFLTLKTTKHGMNMGAMIILVIVFFVSINYFGKKYSKTWDLTEEKLHSLSDQSLNLIKNLDQNIQFIAFYRGAEDEEEKQQVKNALNSFKENSSKVNLRFVNSYVENELAESYLGNIQEKNKLVLFAEYKGKRVRVEEPFSEQNITSSMIKVTREGQKTVYFLTGHGEREIKSEESEGIALFKQRLEESSYIVKELSLITGQVIPTDADIIAIVGPTLQILEGERELLKDYLRKGGRLFIAADPGEKHDISLLTKIFGVEFRNNYILDVGLNRLMGRGVAGILGIDFDRDSEITKKFIGQRGFTVFDKVSELTEDPNLDPNLKITSLIRSAKTSFIVNELKNIKKPEVQDSHVLAMLVEGKLPPAKGESSKDKPNTENANKEFAAIVFGDSDFVAQKDIINGFNIDLALNAISFLAKETDLISIQPKAPKGTQMTLTSTKMNVMVVLGLLIPLIFMVMSGTMWFRRRSA
ncbi:MAG: GldG family protein [Bdellovibrionaceae bacterium]|nr:GldG family protein [Pseudobdellovibrionaceae bacterium]